jgi:hypothetical protein
MQNHAAGSGFIAAVGHGLQGNLITHFNGPERIFDMASGR